MHSFQLEYCIITLSSLHACTINEPHLPEQRQAYRVQSALFTVWQPGVIQEIEIANEPHPPEQMKAHSIYEVLYLLCGTVIPSLISCAGVTQEIETAVDEEQSVRWPYPYSS